MTDPALSPFENRSKKTNELLPPSYQTNVTFTIVDYPNDDPDESVIGQAIRMYYTISLYTGSGFYKLAKAAMGGELSPDWKPNVADMKGKLVTASLVHKEKKGDSETVYARVDSVTAYRGRKKDFGTVKENQRWLSKDEWEAQNNTNGNTSTDDVPF